MEISKEPEFLTIDEMAKVMRVTKRWIYERTRKGPKAIPLYRFGKNVRFKKEEVLKFFEDPKNQTC